MKKTIIIVMIVIIVLVIALYLRRKFFPPRIGFESYDNLTGEVELRVDGQKTTLNNQTGVVTAQGWSLQLEGSTMETAKIKIFKPDMTLRSVITITELMGN
jgi:uncharacterized protein YxeA